MLRLLALLLLACGGLDAPADAGKVNTVDPPQIAPCLERRECCYPFPTGLVCVECCA